MLTTLKIITISMGIRRVMRSFQPIAKTIKNAIRHMDFVARYGGEEFVVLLPETDAHGAYAVASRFIKQSIV